jgi:hypothetical protein
MYSRDLKIAAMREIDAGRADRRVGATAGVEPASVGNFLLGPRLWNEDFSVFKYFDITEKVKLRLPSDFFNLFNHPNDKNPNATTGLINLSQQLNDPRIIQFSARIEF